MRTLRLSANVDTESLRERRTNEEMTELLMASRHVGARAAKYADLDTRTSAVMDARALRQAAEEGPERQVPVTVGLERALLPVTVGLEFNTVSGGGPTYSPILLPPPPTLTHPPHCSSLDGRVQALLARDAQVVKSVVKHASLIVP